MKRMLVLSLVYGLVIASAVLAGDVAQDKAKAKKDREDAKKLWADAKKAHEEAAADFKAARSKYDLFLKDRNDARKLWHDAFLLDKDAANEARKEAIQVEIEGVDAGLKALEDQSKSDQGVAAHWKSQVADEEKALSDLNATIKAEQNAKLKAAEQGLADSTTSEIKGDKGSETNADNQVKADQAAESALNTLKKQLQDELKKLG